MPISKPQSSDVPLHLPIHARHLCVHPLDNRYVTRDCRQESQNVRGPGVQTITMRAIRRSVASQLGARACHGSLGSLHKTEYARLIFV
jgi:hypothetical protein